MKSSFYGILGLCRKSNSISLGHDAVKLSLKSNKAYGLFFCSDASQRLKEEFSCLCQEERFVNIFNLDCTMYDIKNAIGFKAAVFTVNNEGLYKLLISNM